MVRNLGLEGLDIGNLCRLSPSHTAPPSLAVRPPIRIIS